MDFEIIAVGPLEANCVIIWDGDKNAIVIDPGDEPEMIMDVISAKALKVHYIVCTHAHFDHVGAVPEIKKLTGALIAVHEAELELYNGVRDQGAMWGYELEDLPAPDRLLKDGDELRAGSIHMKALHTPGHSPGGVCLYGGGVLITGDTLFAGSIGRTDFHGGSMGQILESLKKLARLPEDTKIIAGHGPTSTLGEELKHNPFYKDLGF